MVNNLVFQRMLILKSNKITSIQRAPNRMYKPSKKMANLLYNTTKKSRCYNSSKRTYAVAYLCLESGVDVCYGLWRVRSGGRGGGGVGFVVTPPTQN